MSFFRPHRLAAIIVAIAAIAWVVTGEFSAIGTAQSETAESSSDVSEVEGAKEETSPPDDEPAIRVVSVLVPEFVDHARPIRLSGQTAPDKHAVLAARAEGIIASLDLQKGTSVTAGMVVMTLEGPETLARAEVARIALDQRERELSVAERLYSGGNTPEIKLITARSARDAAAAEVSLANAAIDRLELKAPFSGLIDSVEVELGEWIPAGSAVATLISLDPIIVRAEVSEIDIDHIEIGSVANISLVNGAKLQGEIRFIAREASSETRTFPVEIELPNPDNTLFSGMTADVEVFAKGVRAVVVPRSVITLSEAGEIGLRVVDAENVTAFVPVGIIDDTLDGLVVTGVPEDVRIIVAGQDLVRDGDVVEVSDAEQASE